VRTLASMLAQECVPAEIIIVDATVPPIDVALLPPVPTGVHIDRLAATQRGAAAQRNQGFAAATEAFVLFLDNDIDLEPGCLRILWDALQDDPALGACGAVITNQHYHPPGRVLRRAFALLGCPATGSLAGRCCGPALNFLPALDAPEPVTPADWLNLCCTLVRRPALPVPPLLDFFHGYSLMEDAALTLEIAKRWRLAAPPAARVFHDVRPAAYKDRPYAREKMEVINRWFVLRCIMSRTTFAWDLRMAAFQAGMLLLSLRTAAGWRRLPAALAGRVAGAAIVLLHGHRWRGYMFPPHA